MKSRNQRSGLIRLPKSLDPICVTLLPRSKEVPQDKRPSTLRNGRKVNCGYLPGAVTSVVDLGSVRICKYVNADDAQPTDYVTDFGGPRVVTSELVPIFFGNLWNGANPSIATVMRAIQTILASPYLSQLDQYGFDSLTLHQPVQALSNPNMPNHTDDDAGDLVWDLIDSNVFPEPDEPGGRNVYMVFYPPGTTIDTDDRCGAHNVFSDTDFPFDIDYAWVGYAEFDQRVRGNTIDSITKIFTHELVEILTDPEPDGDDDEGWQMNRTINGAREIGDACNNVADWIDGVLVNGYWSERHKACIIPKRHRSVYVTNSIATVSTQNGPSDTVNLDDSCHKGTYTWYITYETQEITFVAHAGGFTNPRYTWRVEGISGGETLGGDGFATIFVNAWYEDVNGTSNSIQELSLTFTGGLSNTLVVRNIDPTRGSFDLRIKVTVTEAAALMNSPDNASAPSSGYFYCEKFSFDNRFQDENLACYQRYHKLWLERTRVIKPHVGPDDRRWGWVNQLPPVVSGERLQFVANAAATAAAVQNAAPDLAQQMRSVASALGRVPAELMTPVRLVRGRVTSG